MQSDSTSSRPVVLVLGTGGTIAGLAPDAQRPARYTAAQLGVQHLVDAVPGLAGVRLETEQVAQLDSKDMDETVWATLAARIAAAMDEDGVMGVVVTHGTDTLEETAYLLARLFDAAAKPVVLTAAMRPANAADADGPRNLADAIAVACTGVRGVRVVMQGQAWAGAAVRKRHTSALDAFGTAATRADADIDEHGRVRWHIDRRAECTPGSDPTALPARDWPRVEIVTSHAGADGRIVDLLVADGVRGLVVAGTGHGTLHRRLEAALRRAEAAGVRVVVGSRVGAGAVRREERSWSWTGDATPAQARVGLMLDLLQEARAGTPR